MKAISELARSRAPRSLRRYEDGPGETDQAPHEMAGVVGLDRFVSASLQKLAFTTVSNLAGALSRRSNAATATARQQIKNAKNLGERPMKQKHYNRAIWASTSIAALLASSPALSQDEAPEQQEKIERQTGNIIVVTAQKREESVQDIPISISAFGSETLEQTGFDEIADLANITPSLQIGNFGPVTFVSLRGIGTENTTAGGDPGVALHYDGVYLGRPVGALFSAFDSERVEVLKGPQGTLYGRNATGGSINYITKKPDYVFGGEADITFGNYDLIRTRAAINVPLTDGISTRLVGFFEDRDGFTENTFPGGTRANDAENWGLRGHVNFEFSDAFSLLLSGTYIKAGGVGSKAEYREPFPGSLTGQKLAGPPIPGTNDYLVDGVPLVNDLEPFREAKDFPERQDNDFLLLSATFEGDLGPVSIRSITGYVETSFLSDSDEDGSFKRLTNLLITESAEQFSQEIQFLSNTSSPFQWILGLYYFREEAERRSRFFLGRFDIIADQIGVESGFNAGGTITSESYAAFAQASYELTDTLTITGGIRYTNDEKNGINSGNQFTEIYSGEVGDSWDEITYRAAVDWKVTPDSLLYASFSTGYKSGGINQVVIPDSGRNTIYDPETVNAYEAGLKTTLADGNLRFNLAAYRNEYSDLQFQVFELGGPSSFNAAGATVQGLEIEAQAYLGNSLNIHATLGLTDSEFDNQVLNGVQIGGNKVQRTPDVSFSIGAANEFDLGSAGLLTLRGDVSYTDEIFYSAFNRNAGFSEPGGSDLADSYTNVNLRLFWKDTDDQWNVELYMTNVFDTVQEGNVFRGIGFLDIPGGGGPEQVTYNPPRQYGVRLGRRF